MLKCVQEGILKYLAYFHSFSLEGPEICLHDMSITYCNFDKKYFTLIFSCQLKMKFLLFEWILSQTDVIFSNLGNVFTYL